MELKEIHINEVSLVDNPANKRKFLLFKRGTKEVEKEMKFDEIKLEGIKDMKPEDIAKALELAVSVRDELVKREGEAQASLETAENLKKETDAKLAQIDEFGKALDDASLSKVRTMLIDIQNFAAKMANLAQIALETPHSAEKVVEEAVAKAKDELEKSHAGKIEALKKEYDEVTDELVKAVEALRNSTITKSDVQAMVKEAIEAFKKSIK